MAESMLKQNRVCTIDIKTHVFAQKVNHMVAVVI